MTEWWEHSWEVAFVLRCLIHLTLDAIFKVSKYRKKLNWDFVTWLSELRLVSLNLISHLLYTLRAHIPLIFSNTQPLQSLSHCWKSDLGTILGWAWWSPGSLPALLILWLCSQVGFPGLPVQSQGMWAPPVECAGFCEAALGGSQGWGIREDGSPSLKLFPVCTSCGSCARLMGFSWCLLPHWVKNLFLPITEETTVEISSF